MLEWITQINNAVNGVVWGPAGLALLFGTVGVGLSPATIARCDCTVRIPMAHCVDSLNVAASSAVAFYALRRLSQLGRRQQ